MKQREVILVTAICVVCTIIVTICSLSFIIPLKEQAIADDARLVMYDAKIDYYEKCACYNLRNPSYSELIRFINNDSTDMHPYINNTYVCKDFSYALIRNVTRYGFLCGYARVKYGAFATGHAMVVFDTIDNGLVFVEPQSDVTYKLSVGDKHNSGVITEIILIW